MRFIIIFLLYVVSFVSNSREVVDHSINISTEKATTYSVLKILLPVTSVALLATGIGAVIYLKNRNTAEQEPDGNASSKTHGRSHETPPSKEEIPASTGVIYKDVDSPKIKSELHLQRVNRSDKGSSINEDRKSDGAIKKKTGYKFRTNYNQQQYKNEDGLPNFSFDNQVATANHGRKTIDNVIVLNTSDSEQEKLRLMNVIDQTRVRCSGMWGKDPDAQTCLLESAAIIMELNDGKRFEDLPPKVIGYFTTKTVDSWKDQVELFDFVQEVAPKHFRAVTGELPEGVENPVVEKFGQIEVIGLGNIGITVSNIGKASKQDKKQLEEYITQKFKCGGLALRNSVAGEAGAARAFGHYATFVPGVGFVTAGSKGINEQEKLNECMDDLLDAGLGYTHDEINAMKNHMLTIDDVVPSVQKYFNAFNQNDGKRHELEQSRLTLIDFIKMIDDGK